MFFLWTYDTMVFVFKCSKHLQLTVYTSKKPRLYLKASRRFRKKTERKTARNQKVSKKELKTETEHDGQEGKRSVLLSEPE